MKKCKCKNAKLECTHCMLAMGESALRTELAHCLEKIKFKILVLNEDFEFDLLHTVYFDCKTVNLSAYCIMQIRSLCHN